MADEYTTSDMYGVGTNPEPKPDPGNSPPEQWTAEAADRDDVVGLVARMARGELSKADDEARVNGDLGGTSDPRELSRQFVDQTGGINPDQPITNPRPPAVPYDIANADPADVTTNEGE